MKEDPFGRETEIRIRIRKNALNIGIFVVQIFLLVLAGPRAVRFFMPMLLGWLIAQIANPLVKFLEKHLHIRRRHSSVGIIVGAILLIVFACYNLALWLWRESGQFVKSLPEYYQAFVQGLDQIAENFQVVAERLSPDMREQIAELTGYVTSHLDQIISGLGGGTVEAAGSMAGKIPSLLVSFFFMLLFAYFFIAERERINRLAGRIVPQDTAEQLRLVWGKLKYAVGGYFRAQFKIMFVVFIILAVGFLILGIDSGILLAVLIAFLDFLPMLGTGTALIPWALFFALSGNLPRAAGLIVLYAITQVTRQLIQPKMVGDSIGVDTLTTLFFLFVGYRVSGILGMIIAIPVGLILIQLYEAGAFEHIIASVKELSADIHRLRFPDADKEE